MTWSIVRFVKIILLSNAVQFSIGTADLVRLCEDKTGSINVYRETKDSQHKFTSASCRSEYPSALILKFESREKDCEDYGDCSAKSYIQVNGKKIFDTCGDRALNCYIFATENGAFDLLTESGCRFYALRVYDQLPNVTFAYKPCKTRVEFIFSYDYIVKEPDPTTATTTPISTASDPTTIPNTSNTKRTTGRSSQQTSTTTKSMSSYTPDAATAQYISSTNGSIQKPNTAANTFPLERALSIVFGVLFLITLLAMAVLAISHQRLKSKRANENGQKREVVVNQIYDSFHGQEPEAETVVNELYGTA